MSFCAFCGKALPQKSSKSEVIHPIAKADPIPQKASAQKARL